MENRQRILKLVALASFSIFVLPQSAYAQASRTWVSGVGDDANPCSRTAPCKTFAGAISKTAASGEINCIDPGGFGAVTITKSITIDCGATFGSILAAGTNGIIVNGAGLNVTIRNLSINGIGSGLSGIRFLQSGNLRVDNVSISNFTQRGIDFTPSATSELVVANTDIFRIAGTGAVGINIRPASGATSTNATITLSRIQNNAVGLVVDSLATTGQQNIVLRDSTVTNSGTGIVAQSATSAVFLTLDRCTFNANSTGVSSVGATTNVQLSNSIVAQNSTGLATTGGGKIVSFSSNVLSGNFVSNGAPTSTVPPQ